MRAHRKYILLSGLYIAQTLPGHFFGNVLPVIMRGQGASLASIGFLQIIALPWLLKFLWAPLVDRATAPGGRYARVIVALQLMFCLCTAALALVGLERQLPLALGLMALSYVFAATQDIATDALAVRLLNDEERGPGNAAQTGGNMLGALLGSGGALIAYQYLGWAGVMLAMALALLLPLAPLGWLASAIPARPGAGGEAGATGWSGFFRQRGAGRWTLMMLISYGGSMACVMITKPLMVDLGFSAARIGLLTGVHGVGVGLLGAVAAGWLIPRLGRLAVLRGGCLLGAVAAVAMLPLAWGQTDTAYLLAAIGLGGLGFAATMTAINTIAMDFTRPGHEGADYSLQIAISMIGGGVLMGSSGWLAQEMGYGGVFSLCGALCLAAAGLVSPLCGGALVASPPTMGRASGWLSRAGRGDIGRA
ncbi:MFS transporter [Desulfarculus baarsii]